MLYAFMRGNSHPSPKRQNVFLQSTPPLYPEIETLAFPANVGPQKEALKFIGVQLFFVTATEQEQGLKQENSVKARTFLWSCEKLTPAHCRKYQVLPV